MEKSPNDPLPVSKPSERTEQGMEIIPVISRCSQCIGVDVDITRASNGTGAISVAVSRQHRYNFYQG